MIATFSMSYHPNPRIIGKYQAANVRLVAYIADWLSVVIYGAPMQSIFYIVMWAWLFVATAGTALMTGAISYELNAVYLKSLFFFTALH